MHAEYDASRMHRGCIRPSSLGRGEGRVPDAKMSARDVLDVREAVEHDAHGLEDSFARLRHASGFELINLFLINYP